MTLEVLSDQQGIYQLKGSMTLDTVMEAWPGLPALWGTSAQPVELDFSQVCKIDTAGLAWIIQLLKQARPYKSGLKFKNVPDSLIKLAKISDLEGVLPLK